MTLDGEGLNAIDLFCGAGGLSLGLQKAGFRVRGAVDGWEVAAKTYRTNFTHPCLHTDIRQLPADELLHVLGVQPGTIDLIAGGPPCQGFSIQRIGGDEDDRNDLIFEYGRIVREIRPRMFLMENVPGLLGKRGRQAVESFTRLMRAAGYGLTHTIINAAGYGVPQMRRRVFFIGWLQRELPPFHFPSPPLTPDGYRTVRNALDGLPAVPSDFSPPPNDPLHRRMRMSEMNQERLRLIPPGGGFESLPPEMRVNCHKEGAARIGHRYVYGRLALDEPAGTITARFDSFTRGKFAHPVEHRNITLREGARLQTFPDDFRFQGSSQEEIAALIGNAVPPLLAESLGRAIANHLRQPPRTVTETAEASAADQLVLFDA